MQKNYKGVVWTNHALERLKKRGIKQGDAWVTFRRPDGSKFNKRKGVWVYHRTFKNERVEVVARKNEKGEWLILSVWSKFIKIKTSKHSFWKRLIKKIL